MKPGATDYHTKVVVTFLVTECRDLVRSMLNMDQNERFSAEQVFRSAWCTKAVNEHPDLRYLNEHLKPAALRKPSECVPQEKDEFGRCNFKIRLLLKQLNTTCCLVCSTPGVSYLTSSWPWLKSDGDYEPKWA